MINNIISRKRQDEISLSFWQVSFELSSYGLRTCAIPFEKGNTDNEALAYLNEIESQLLDYARDDLIQVHQKIQKAPDFIVASPKIATDKKQALQEAKDEILKEEKSIAKLSLTLPKLIEYVEELEGRIKKLETGY